MKECDDIIHFLFAWLGAELRFAHHAHRCSSLKTCPEWKNDARKATLRSGADKHSSLAILVTAKPPLSAAGQTTVDFSITLSRTVTTLLFGPSHRWGAECCEQRTVVCE